MKKCIALKNSIDYFIHKMIHHSAWKIAQAPDDLHSQFYLHKPCSLDTSDETTSICLTVCWRKMIVFFIHNQQQYHLKDKQLYIMVFSDFWWDKFFSKNTKLLSHYVSIKLLYWAPFLFLSFHSFPSLFINSIFLSFRLNFLLLSILGSNLFYMPAYLLHYFLWST